MKETLMNLLKSKKFWMTIIGSAVCGGLTFAGVPSETIVLVAGLFGVNIGAQGIADLKK